MEPRGCAQAGGDVQQLLGSRQTTQPKGWSWGSLAR